MKHSNAHTFQNISFGRRFLVLGFLLFAYVASAQDNNQVANGPTSESAQSSQSSVGSQMELLFWFMGTKQSKTSNGFDEDEVTSRKKQLIRSGITPNRILSRTFMNKALNYESTLV